MGQKHIRTDMQHEKVNLGYNPKPYESKGRVFVKKAQMFLNYEFHNDPKKPDVQEWSD